MGIDKEITKAIRSAQELKSALTAATDVNTGKLDLTKFSNTL